MSVSTRPLNEEYFKARDELTMYARSVATVYSVGTTSTGLTYVTLNPTWDELVSESGQQALRLFHEHAKRMGRVLVDILPIKKAL